MTQANQDIEDMLKEFIFCEMIHDFKTDRMKRPQGHVIGADVINFKRYSCYADKFNQILDSGVTTAQTSAPYNSILNCSSDNVEDTLLSYIANTSPLNLQDFINSKIALNGTVTATQITTNVTNHKYNIRGIRKDKIVSGSNLLTIIGNNTPIFLIDTGSIIRDLKKGKADTTKQAYIFSPLVTMCDSAGGFDPIDGINTSKNKIRFANDKGTIGKTLFTGIILNNVYSTSDYTISPATPHTSNEFFSKFTINIKYNPSTKKIIQTWTNGTDTFGTGPPAGYNYPQNFITYEWYEDNKNTSVTSKKSFAATVTAHTFEPPDILNSQPNCFNFIRKYINGPEKTPPVAAKPTNQRWLENEARLMSNTTFNNRVALALALQRKRAGDWLPVSYILDYDSNNAAIKLTQQNWDTTNKKIITAPLPSANFKSIDMYIVTEDRPLVAYCLFRGVNVIYYMNGFGPVIFRKN